MNVLLRLRERYGVTTQPLRTERRVEAALLLLLLLLIMQLAWGVATLRQQLHPEAIEPASDTVQLMVSPEREAVTSAQSNDIRNRPLLWLSRRPEVEVVEVVKPKKPEEKQGTTDLDKMKVVGLFGAGESAGMIVRLEGEPHRLRLGEQLAGWTLESVTEKDVVLQNGARRETLALERLVVPSANAKSSNSNRRKR